MPKYLTEENLKEILRKVVPEHTFIHDKAVPGSINCRRRPDFRCDELKLIIEFDGYQHYTNAKNIIIDTEKDADYSFLGYCIVRIPYFVQMASPLLKHIFNREIYFEQYYPHGFIDDKAMLPADFCELGIKKFINDLNTYSFCRDEILESLRRKVKQLGNINLVLPPSLENLL